jgi:hypothetical protein
MTRYILALLLLLSNAVLVAAQTVTDNVLAVSAGSEPSVPAVLKFSSNMQERDGTIAFGPKGITFALYKDEAGGVPLWIETRSVVVDHQGRFTVFLGSTSPQGIPVEIFTSGEPRWIGITPDGGVARPRVQLGSVPYALKAADADTLAGRRPEEFVSLQQFNFLLNDALGKLPNPISSPLSFPTSGRAPAFEATSPSGPSFVSKATSGPPLQVESELLVPNLNSDFLHGFTDSAFAKLKEKNLFSAAQSFPGGVRMSASNLEPNSAGVYNSATLDFESSVSNPQTNVSFKQLFRWASQSLSGTTAGATAHLSLSFGANEASPSPTGLSINPDGTINFAPGQQLPVSAIVGALSGSQADGGTGGSVSNTPIVNTALYSWIQTPPQANAIQVGANNVTLTPCPRGVNGTDLWHYLYISGKGTPEVVLVTGGSCTSHAATGTIEFTANYAHPVGYSIGSATDGVQEGVIDAVMSKTNAQVSREVMIDPGAHRFRARLSIRGSGMTIVASGAVITCAMSDTCIMMGDPSNSNMFSRIVLRGLRVGAGVASGTWPAVEDNANGSEIDNFGPAPSPISQGSFGSLVQIDNDQAAVIDGLDTNLAPWGRCDTSFCSTGIVGPGPFSKNAGVLWVKNSNLALECAANGIDNQNGNTLHVSDSVVQAFPQFGIRARTVYNPETVKLDSVYEEVGNCTNPLGTGMAGLIVEGGQATVSGGSPAGTLPQFANTGTARYNYYVVVHSSTMGTSSPYLAGYANSNGTDAINVIWNQVGTAGVITYDILRILGDGGDSTVAPYGTGAFAVATGVPATLCVNKTCSVLDYAAASPAAYTIGDSLYWPALTMWPGSIILTTVGDLQNTGGAVPTQYFTDALSTSNGAGIVNSAGASQPSVFAQRCDAQGNWSSIWMQCTGGTAYSNNYPRVTGTLLQLSVRGGAPGGLKGRLIFEMPVAGAVGGTHVITLADSNPDKTLATPNNRPSWDANDTYIGYDQSSARAPTTTQLAFGSPVSISRYVGNPGDDVNWLERLTASGETFKVPVQVTQLRSGTSANTDLAGTIVISDTTLSSYTFAGNYVSAPRCTLTPLSDPSVTGVYWASITNTTLTANVKMSGKISFSYGCSGLD